jgi:hypothetical protein
VAEEHVAKLLGHATTVALMTTYPLAATGEDKVKSH